VVVTRHAGVHRHGHDSGPPGHSDGLSGATAVFHQRAPKAKGSTAMVTAMGMAVHRPFYPETRFSRVWLGGHRHS
jgi:hypothetical protein